MNKRSRVRCLRPTPLARDRVCMLSNGDHLTRHILRESVGDFCCLLSCIGIECACLPIIVDAARGQIAPLMSRSMQSCGRCTPRKSEIQLGHHLCWSLTLGARMPL